MIRGFSRLVAARAWWGGVCRSRDFGFYVARSIPRPWQATLAVAQTKMAAERWLSKDNKACSRSKWLRET